MLRYTYTLTEFIGRESKLSVVVSLVERLFDARAKGKLEFFLKQRKEQLELPQNAFRTSGTNEELLPAVVEAVNGRHVTIDELARLVDEVEENGAQHIFIFRVADEGNTVLTADAVEKLFPHYPRPTEELYSDQPTARRTYVKRRADGGVAVKQIYRCEFWERDTSASHETATRRTIVYNLARRRAVNMLVVNPDGSSEIRISHVSGKSGDEFVLALLKDFLDSLKTKLDVMESLAPLPVWDTFQAIANARDETYMSVDEKSDASIRLRFSNWRERSKGTDVRDHPDYPKDAHGYRRDSLNVYWLTPDANDGEKVHTILSSFDVEQARWGKVYVSARLDPHELDHVIARIRYFAAEAAS
ncbi:MAG: hypothetical protein JWO97_4594 [Acidobacteria bacterium]|nr:hypothetical protein [Acidobacteriota bacterium]